MTSMQHWTPEQWAVFGLTIAAGIAAAILLYAARSAVLGWPAPTPARRVAPTAVPRPSLVLAERRTSIDRDMRVVLADAYEATGGVKHHLPAWVDPMAADFTDPGIGALSSIQAMTIDPTLKTSVELSTEESAWVNAYADLSDQMPETDAAVEQMRVALEPALRKARAWRIRGERGRDLNDWRMNTPTGEYAILTTNDLAPYARALLAS
jgi:hypothetical protein